MYSIKEAAARSGVSVPTLRAWERRYGVVKPVRTEGGYRLYDEDQIRRLLLMRRLLDDGWRPREAAAEILSGRDLGILPADAPPPAPAAPLDGVGLIRAFAAAVSPFDSAAIDAVLDETFSRAGFETAVEQVVFPALRDVGRRWATGEISVAAEHAASHQVLRRLSMLFEAAGRAASGHEVVIGLPPGARHELGALAFGVAARRLGLTVLYLGPDVPLDSWLETLDATGARGAVIAVPTPADASAAGAVVVAGRQSVPGVSWFVGGAGAEDPTLTEVGAIRLPNGVGESARHLREALP